MADGFRTEIKGIPELKRKLSQLELEAFPRAAARTLNSVATTVRAEQSRAIKEVMGLSKIGAVKRRIKIRRANPSDLSVQLDYTGRPLNLIEFRARQLKAGVKARPWGQTRLFRGAFITEIHGNQLVMIRRKRAGGRIGTGETAGSKQAAAAAAAGRSTRAGRLPIRAMFGPGIANTAQEPEIAKLREKTVTRVLTERLKSNLEFEVSKLLDRG